MNSCPGGDKYKCLDRLKKGCGNGDSEFNGASLWSNHSTVCACTASVCTASVAAGHCPGHMAAAILGSALSAD